MKEQYKLIKSMKEVPDQLRKLRREYIRYQQAELIYSLSHKKLLELASDAGAIFRIDSTVLINREIFDAYLERFHEPAIQQNHEMGIFKRMEIYNKRYPPVHPHYQKLRQDFRKAIMEAFGIYRTYLYYCYLLGKLPTATPNYRPPHPAMREDYRRWAEIEKQLHLLERHSLNTAEDVAAFASEQERKLADLETQRAKCRNRLRRCRDPTECEALHTEKDELTKQITETRKELKTAQQIPSRVKRMRENIQLLNDREQQRAAHRKER